MKEYKIVVHNHISKEDRLLNVKADNINEAIEVVNFGLINHPSEDIVEIRADYKGNK